METESNQTSSDSDLETLLAGDSNTWCRRTFNLSKIERELSFKANIEIDNIEQCIIIASEIKKIIDEVGIITENRLKRENERKKGFYYLLQCRFHSRCLEPMEAYQKLIELLTPLDKIQNSWTHGPGWAIWSKAKQNFLIDNISWAFLELEP